MVQQNLLNFFYRSKDSNMIFHQKNGLSFELNKNDFTAQIIYSPDAKGDIFIQRSIDYQSQEYVVTGIQKGSFKNNSSIYSIKFSNDSKLRIISKNAFSNSSIQSLSFPSSLEELEDGWCKHTWRLNQIYISPGNKIYKYLDDDHQIIVKKSNPEENEYDVLVFGSPSIKRVYIPSTIKKISSFAFSNCNIQKVEFDKNTKLESIGREGISLINMKNFFIPETVKDLKDGWYIEFFNPIEIFLTKENNFFKYIEGNMIVGKSNPNNEDFDVLEFASRNIKKAVIPSKIKFISSNSFMNCRMLEKVEFSEDSELISIGKSAFRSSSLKSITIPSHVKIIEKCAFAMCSNLASINFTENSELYSIKKKAFMHSSIESLSIPKNLEKFEEGWCCDLWNLKNVIISKLNKNFSFLDENKKIIVSKSDSKSDIFDVIVFACRDIKKAFIPSTIKYICSYAFAYCKYLKTVNFSEDSKLREFGKFCFADSSINQIKIPSSIQKIPPYLFYCCKDLEKVELSKNSQLKIISECSFCETKIKFFYFPPKLEKLVKFWSQKMNYLNFIEISEENRNFKYLDFEKNIIVGKSDLKSDVYDVIVLAFKNLEKAVIPSKIKYINPFSFSLAEKLDSIEFSKSSELIEINEFAFNYSSIREIKIPSSVTYIGNSAFSCCLNLKKIVFEKNSKIEFFNGELFECSTVESISIPENVKELRPFWCSEANNLRYAHLSSENKNFLYLDEKKQIIIEKKDKKSDIFDVIVFVSRNVKEVNIPHSIKFIRENAFSGSLIQKVLIPNSIKKIERNSFNGCKCLEKVEFECEFDSLIIEDNAFYKAPIESLFVPAKKLEIGNSAFFRSKLKSIELMTEEFFIDSFLLCRKTVIVSFPNATKIYASSNSLFETSHDVLFFVQSGADFSID